ncbi:DEKNAAC102086 [Brettanomyces naardenensis]|uniref:Probable NADPH dehydrogenase n=1 Tax=Brettanomyces naardenensis TaxID=13370 RepID=A0A448YJY0_BRENA|nr:DEKNAAC102086 [Brettanomyces naardenensis]
MSGPPLAKTNLFKPIKVGPVTLKNRLAFAPTTRYRNTVDFVPTDSMRTYYEQRATDNGGLLITEATFAAPGFGLYSHAPGIDDDRKVEAWRKIVEAVHSKGTFISIQLWNLGRAADPKVLKEHGLPFVAPSPIYIDDKSKKAAEDAGNPLRALTLDEIHAEVKEYAAAAKRAINGAKFDIVEIHGAHGYLLDQFTSEAANKRTDEYGGSIENRARFLLEAVDAIIEAVGAEHTAIRLSPYAQFQGVVGINAKTNPIVTYGYILSELERRAKEGKRLAYVSFAEPRVAGGTGGRVAPEGFKPPVVNTSWWNEIWKGVIIRSGNLLHDEGYTLLKEYVDADDRTLIGASRYYTSNPDLANRLKNGYPLTKYDRSTFYNVESNEGYVTWPKYGEKADEEIGKVKPKALA